MNHISGKQKYVALLRGINVGGHHKVPMAQLKQEFQALGFTAIQTLLNSGNVVFEGDPVEEESLEKMLADHLSHSFEFPIPVLVRGVADIKNSIHAAPFKNIEVHKDIRLYVTFFKEIPAKTMDFPWVSDDGSFQILLVKNKMVFSVLDVSQTKSTDAMNVLEKIFGKQITTRNWNTLLKIVAL